MNFLADQNVLVLGLGASGLALARWCVRCGARVTVADTRPAPPQLASLQTQVPGAVFVCSDLGAALLETARFDMVLKSPGLSPVSVAGVVEALSVMVQVIWFKYTKKRYGTGRRLLKMAPLHHHFEKSGWKETQVVVRFWIITMLLCLVGLSTLKLR